MNNQTDANLLPAVYEAADFKNSYMHVFRPIPGDDDLNIRLKEKLSNIQNAPKTAENLAKIENWRNRLHANYEREGKVARTSALGCCGLGILVSPSFLLLAVAYAAKFTYTALNQLKIREEHNYHIDSLPPCAERVKKTIAIERRRQSISL